MIYKRVRIPNIAEVWETGNPINNLEIQNVKLFEALTMLNMRVSCDPISKKKMCGV